MDCPVAGEHRARLQRLREAVVELEMSLAAKQRTHMYITNRREHDAAIANLLHEMSSHYIGCPICHRKLGAK